VHLFTHYFEENNPTVKTVRNTSIEVATAGDGRPAIVGLGLKSTLVDALFDQELISGRTVGYYGGSSTPRAGGVINGSLTFGGYDSGRFSGDVHTYDMDTTSPDILPLNVTNIIIESSDGRNNVSLLDQNRFSNLNSSDNTFTAKLTTDQFPISLPYEITQNFIDTLSAVPSDLPDGSLRLDKPFNGTMTFVLSDSFRVTIPHDVLFNSSGNSIVKQRNRTDPSPFYLGLPFMSQIYLIMDYDATKFHIATAIQEQQYVVPVTMCSGDTPKQFERPNHGSFSRAGLVGIIIAAVIGGISLISTAFLAVVMIRHQRKVDKEEKAERLEAQRLKQIHTQGFEPMEEISEEERERTPLMSKKRLRFWEW
jgi:hypothetical protein